jgi:hypothetical protein
MEIKWKWSGNKLEIRWKYNRNNPSRLGEIEDSIRISMVFHEACLPEAGEAKCISTVFP